MSSEETTARRAYVDGPPNAVGDVYADCYQADEDPAEAAAMLATSIDWWLCGPRDDGEEGQEYILTSAVERAGRFIAAQPCVCDLPDGDLCARCVAIGCDYEDHRTPTCCPSGLAGRVVVDLPEPDEKHDRTGGPEWVFHVGSADVWTKWVNGELGIRMTQRASGAGVTFSPDDARSFAAAILAAADAAERLSVPGSSGEVQG